MAPVFMNEFMSRREYYIQYIHDVIEVSTDNKNDEEMLTLLQNFRVQQYEKLMDVVYKEKGYDPYGIPFDETLERLGFENKDYFDIVKSARERVESTTRAN